MKLIIDIPDKTYHKIINGTYDYGDMNVIIQNGTPLPKGHGDLIDKSKICKASPAEEDNCTGMGMTYDEMDAYNDGINAMYNLVQWAKPIIEADMRESIGEKIRCNTCKNNDDELSGECYECVKGIFDHYEKKRR